jgi:putative peptide zinc metalloprotease protein
MGPRGDRPRRRSPVTPERPTPAKLELLVRRDGEDDFELRQVASVVGYLSSRPRRIEPGSFEISELRSRVADVPGYILKNTTNDRFLLLSDQERFLWEQMDGATSLQEIATAYVLKYGEFDFDIIPSLLRKLQRAQLLTFEPRSRLRQALARNRDRLIVKAIEVALTGLERIRIASVNVHPFFQRLYRYGGFLLFTPVAVVACLGLALLGGAAAVLLFHGMHDVMSGFGGRALLGLLTVKLLFFGSVALHQFVHGLACIHYRRRVREFGFTFLHGFVPTFYVDVTDIFMASRRARVVTAVTGALVHLVLGAAWFIVAAQAPTASFTQAFAAASGIIQWQALVIALYPFCFIEMDGYHVLVDVLGVPTLKGDAITYVKGLVSGATRLRLGREEGLWLGYVVLSTLSVAAFIAFNVWIVVSATN